MSVMIAKSKSYVRYIVHCNFDFTSSTNILQPHSNVYDVWF